MVLRVYSFLRSLSQEVAFSNNKVQDIIIRQTVEKAVLAIFDL